MKMRTVGQMACQSDSENEIDFEPWATLIDGAVSVARVDYKELLQTFIEDDQLQRQLKG